MQNQSFNMNKNCKSCKILSQDAIKFPKQDFVSTLKNLNDITCTVINANFQSCVNYQVLTILVGLLLTKRILQKVHACYQFIPLYPLKNHIQSDRARWHM